MIRLKVGKPQFGEYESPKQNSNYTQIRKANLKQLIIIGSHNSFNQAGISKNEWTSICFYSIFLL